MVRRTVLATAAAYQRILGANARGNIGMIGAGGRGRFLAGEFKEIGFQIPAVCDVYQPNLEAGLKGASTYKTLLNDKSLDAVKQTRRIVQVGTQRRSSPVFQEAKSIIDSGVLGDVRLVTSWWLNHQAALNPATLAGPLDWQVWLGTSPQRPVDAMRFFNRYYIYDYAGGLIVGQAAHIFDAIQQFINSHAPLAVTAVGRQLNLKGSLIPDTATIVVEFPENYLANFTLGYKAMRYHQSQDQLKQFHGAKARLDVSRDAWALYPGSPPPELKPTRDHIRNFLDCIQSRKQPNAPVENGLTTAIALVMTMESLRKAKRVTFNAATRQTSA